MCGRPPSRHLPGQTPGRHPLGQTPQAETPGQTSPCPWDTHTPCPVHAGIHPLPSACWDTPPAQCMLGYTPWWLAYTPVATADSMHPTGMHSCINVAPLGVGAGGHSINKGVVGKNQDFMQMRLLQYYNVISCGREHRHMQLSFGCATVTVG